MRTDPAMALRFFRALFPEGAWLHFRAVPEPKDETRWPTNHWYAIDKLFPEMLTQFLDYCVLESRAAFFLPAIARPGKSHKDAVEALPCVPLDLDTGNPALALTSLETIYMRPADIVVESGGITASGNAKLHAYWKITPPAGTPEEIASACRLRQCLARATGADACLKQEAQVLRIPGSIHFKNGPKLVRMIRCPA
jgi:putative DNA primase/helicase